VTPRRILDHLSVARADPLALIEVASGAGFDGVGLFLHGMSEVPGMADYNLIHDRAARRACRQRLDDSGCEIAIAYPFTLSRTTQLADLLPALDAAADLGARAINVLVFDREPVRRAATLHDLCAAASERGIAVGVEFFPVSAVPTLGDAIALCDAAGGQGRLIVDLLHLHRSGGTAAMLATASEHILLVQLCDAPADPPGDGFAEASSGRLLPGTGDIDLRAMLRALAPRTAISIEAPRADAADYSLGKLAADARHALDLVLSPEFLIRSVS
jgi:sugar phosphate isomerase/epimerase